MTVLRIRDWSRHFENNRTRELKTLEWVPVPNKMDGDGYTELVEVREGEDPADGALRYAAWCALILIASKSHVRGTLLREGAAVPQEGATIPQDAARGSRAHDASTAARISRLPRRCFELCIERALEIGWLERIDLADAALNDIPQEGATIPHPAAEKRLRNGREGNGIKYPPNPPGGAEGGRMRLAPDERIAKRIAEVKL